jgi:hypothetical protein
MVVGKCSAHLLDLRRQEAALSRVVKILPVETPIVRHLSPGLGPLWLRRPEGSNRAKRGIFYVFNVFCFASLLRRCCVIFACAPRVDWQTYTLIFVVFADGYDRHACVGLCVNHTFASQHSQKSSDARLGPSPLAGDETKRRNKLPALQFYRAIDNPPGSFFPGGLGHQPQPCLAAR